MSRRFKEACIATRGSKCERCGYSKCPGALDFHHRNPEHKKFNISTWCQSHHGDFTALKTELDKCDLLCSNCHRELHFFDLPNVRETKCKFCENAVIKFSCPVCPICLEKVKTKDIELEENHELLVWLLNLVNRKGIVKTSKITELSQHTLDYFINWIRQRLSLEPVHFTNDARNRFSRSRHWKNPKPDIGQIIMDKLKS